MYKNLIIVESPAKAKTIQKFIDNQYEVVSSKGHVRDLPQKEIGIDISGGFIPQYEVIPDKKKMIQDLKKLADKAELVLLATDDDREGEAISWHLMEAIGIPKEKTKRIVFHEITKSAIEKAIQSPRDLDIDLVNAQQARRVLDRLVGFELSPVLWRKVKPQLSAGRVQSVAVKLIVEREREIIDFDITSNYRVVGEFYADESKQHEFEAVLNKRFETQQESLDFLNSCINAQFVIDGIEKSPAKRSPAAPFTTSTLQQEASRKLGFSVSKTMVVAQQLYEAGYITYMRTDSVNLSDFAIESFKEEIINLYGKEYSKTRKYRSKIKGAQEAHEAIRPTNIKNHTISGDASAKRLYDLIWKRAIASQMSDAEIEKTTINIPVPNREEKFVANGEVILFQGFLKVYSESKDEDEEEVKGWLPPLKKGETVINKEIHATQKFSQPPARYTEASLVKKLEDLGIGRPSTYAPTITTIQKREYVIKSNRPGQDREYLQLVLKNNQVTKLSKKEKFGAEKDKLFPTDIGIVVNDYLQDNFENILDYGFTAGVEKEFDEIAEGEKSWKKMIDTFYKDFHESVEQAMQHTSRANRERLLGQDPKTSANVYAKLGKYGPMVQIGENSDDQKPTYARMKESQFIETITLEEALDLFKLPKTVGVYENEDLVIGIGRFGPYVKYGNNFVSIPKNEDPNEVDHDRAVELIENKKKIDAERAPRLLGEYNGHEVHVIVGRYGPYIKYDSQNITLGKGVIPSEVSLDDAIEWIKNSKTKNVILAFEEDEKIKVMNGRYGPYLTNGTDNFKIPKGTVAEKLTYKECLDIIQNTTPTAKKRFPKKK